MTEDNFYVLGASLILGVLLFFTFLVNRKFGLVNGIVFITYLLLFLVLRNFNSEYGKALVWLMLLLFTMAVQTLTLILYLVFRNKKN